jgi:hypothetical protein
MNKCTLVFAIAMITISGYVCEREEKGETMERRKKTLLTKTGNGIEATHTTRKK